MEQTTTPNSLSLYNAFKQFENEIVQEQQSQLKQLVKTLKKIKDGNDKDNFPLMASELKQIAAAALKGVNGE
jgi:hypothetical protein